MNSWVYPMVHYFDAGSGKQYSHKFERIYTTEQEKKLQEKYNLWVCRNGEEEDLVCFVRFNEKQTDFECFQTSIEEDEWKKMPIKMWKVFFKEADLALQAGRKK